MTTHYETLGVGPRATADELKDAYRAKARAWHPDKHEGEATRAEAEAKFKEITFAYWVLSDPHRKLMYDEKLVRAAEAKRTHSRVPVQHTQAHAPRNEPRWRDQAADAVRRAAEAEARAQAQARAKRRDEGFDSYQARMQQEREQAQAQAQGFTEFLRQQAKKAGTLS